MSVRTPHRIRQHVDGEWAGRTEHYFPSVNAGGLYVLGDPRLGREHHHKKNAVYAEDIRTALHLVKAHGFSIRMRGDLTGQVNLIRHDEIRDL